MLFCGCMLHNTRCSSRWGSTQNIEEGNTSHVQTVVVLCFICYTIFWHVAWCIMWCMVCRAQRLLSNSAQVHGLTALSCSVERGCLQASMCCISYAVSDR
jgi:heme/copper-type cytochrome/quinol oxidase subunit 2